jgi:probable HAF family extracellular repeat protein
VIDLHRTIQLAAALTLPLAFASTAGAGGQLVVEFVRNFPPAVCQRVNSAGQIAGDFQLNAQITAMRYDPGVGRIALDRPAGTTQSIGTSINSAGTVVGRVSYTGGTVGAIWAPDNSVTLLPNPPGNWSYSTPSGINDSGMICGFATLAVVGADPQEAWRWTADKGYEFLDSIGGLESFVRDINSAGRCAGHSALGNGSFRAVRWELDGAATVLGLLPGSTQTYASSINDSGAVVGTTNSNGDAWVYTDATGMVKLPDFGTGLKAAAYDINNAGWILGWADVAPFKTVPVVWDPQRNLHNIADLVDPSRFYFSGDFIRPIAISETNEIVVFGYDFTAGGDPRVLVFRFGFPSACAADINGDGARDGLDLAALLAAWGSGDAAADLDGNGTVNASDLTALLAAWGPC